MCQISQIGKVAYLLIVTQRQIVLWKVLEWLALILVRPVQLRNANAGKIMTVPGRGLYVSLPLSSLLQRLASRSTLEFCFQC